MSSADDPEQVREFLAARNLRRQGWARFQASSRRAALRMVRDRDDGATVSTPGSTNLPSDNR
ncbi:hypothetical protein ACFZB5_13595 [Streptomyces nodosus]|uniref:hypothetical protein n=1 Tax=Streptomyces nodosus TaxID=40318 RepID=UPI0036EF6063